MSSKVKIKHTKTYKNNLGRKRRKNNLHILNAQNTPVYRERQNCI